MTLSEYMSREKFPLTTRSGLTPRRQLTIDSFNLDSILEAVDEERVVLTPEQQARYAELQEKAKQPPCQGPMGSGSPGGRLGMRAAVSLCSA